MVQKKLEAVINEKFETDFYVHALRANYVTVTETYHVLTLETNCGLKTSIFDEETPETKAVKKKLIESVVSVEGKVFTVKSSTNETLYSVDLSRLIPEDWEFKVERLTKGRPISFGAVFYHPDHADEVVDVHPITNADFRHNGEPQCESIMQSSAYSVFPTGVQCEREEKHIGNHQAIFANYTYVWDYLDRPSSGDPYGQYGFRSACSHCGFVSAGNASGVRDCSTCSFWSDQKAAAGGFIIDGRHYRPGRGGFGGAVFHVTRNDGSKWSGELFTQGEVPPWLRDKFPDNAAFDQRKSSFGDMLSSL